MLPQASSETPGWRPAGTGGPEVIDLEDASLGQTKRGLERVIT